MLDCTSQAWIKFQTLPQCLMLRRHIVLLIAIRPSNGEVKPGGPLGAFREEQAMSWHLVSPSPFLSSSSHRTQLLYTKSYTYSHPNLNFLQYTIQILIPHVMWSSQVVHDLKNRPHSMPSICLAWNLKCIIVQWVGIGTHTHTLRGRRCDIVINAHSPTGDKDDFIKDSFYRKLEYSFPDHHQCSAQGQILHCKLRHQGCNSTQRQVFNCKLRNLGCNFTRDE